MIENHLTLCVERISACGNTVCRGESFTERNTCVLNDLIVIVDKIIAALKLNELICLLHNTVDIQVIADHAVVDNHLTFRIEGVFASRKIILASKFLTELNGTVLERLVIVVNKVVIAFKFNELICLLHNVIDI